MVFVFAAPCSDVKDVACVKTRPLMASNNAHEIICSVERPRHGLTTFARRHVRSMPASQTCFRKMVAPLADQRPVFRFHFKKAMT
jgi:hypothetical protein